LEKSGNVEVVQQYHSMVNVLEAVVESTKSMKDLTELLNIIEAWHKNELEIVQK
jgi:hypothetical protein